MKTQLLRNYAILITLVVAGTFSLLQVDEKASYTPREKKLNGDYEYGYRGAADYYNLARAGKSGSIDPAAILKAEKQAKHAARKKSSLQMSYSLMGPDNMAGRTRAMLIDKNNPDRIFAGSVSGGIYVSDNRGATWYPHKDFSNTLLNSSIISSIVQTPEGDIFVGTGCSFENRASLSGVWPGKGVFRSTDGGENFEQLPTTMPQDPVNATSEQWHDVNRLAVDPINGKIYACTQRGLMVSNDNGDSWEHVIFLDPNQTLPNANLAYDISIGEDGTVIAAVGNGIYKSRDGSPGSFERLSSGLPGGWDRVVLAMAPSDNNYVYAMIVDVQGSLATDSITGNHGGVYRSVDQGESWERIFWDSPGITIMGDNRQGFYDAALAVYPNDPGKILMGGVELWRWNGTPTRVSTEQAGLSPVSDLNPLYVHADKHLIYFDPMDPTGNTLYITHDGGISRSEDGGNTFVVLNKGYTSLQFYSIAYSNLENLVIGGTQDNGTNLVGFNLLGERPNVDPLAAVELSGGDGFDCEISQISEVFFTTVQNTTVNRAVGRNGQAPLVEISQPYTGELPFQTTFKLWESLNDPTSKDSIVFKAEPTELALGVGNGVTRNYTGTVSPIQEAASIVDHSVEIIVGSMRLDNTSDNNVLSGDGTGSITYNGDKEMTISITLDEAPTVNTPVFVRFSTRYKANQILNLTSATADISFTHKLEVDLNPGEELSIQDPVQSLMVMSKNGGVAIARGALITDKPPIWFEFTDGITSNVTCAEFTSDGNHLFVGTREGKLYRISGLNDLYEFADIDLHTTVTEIYSAPNSNNGQALLGIASDYNDPQKLVITLGRYGFESNIKYITEALTDNWDVRDVHTDGLPQMPIYDAEIDKNNPSIVILGTDLGVWSTDNIDAANPEDVVWSDENDAWTYVPVHDVRQQKLSWERAKNSGVYYFGSHGKGIWKSTTLVSADDEVDDLLLHDDFITDLKVFPSPMQDQGTISFTLRQSGVADIAIYDLGGREVRSFKQQKFVSGENNFMINVSGLPVGTYLATLGASEDRKVSRFVIVR